jgi:periplasmic protein TonB
MFGTLIESRAHAQRRAGGAALSVAFHVTVVAAAIVAGARAAPARPVRPTIVRVTLAPPRSTPRHREQRQAARTRTLPTDLPTAPQPRIPALAPIVPGVPSIDVPQSTPMSVALDGRASSDLRSIVGDLIGDGSGDQNDGAGPWTDTELQMHILTRVTPRYPEPLRQAGVDGRVRVRFTVDTTGRIDPHSVDVLESTNDMFAQSVRAALRGFRFIPSLVRGHRVASLAEMSFLFTVRQQPQ